MVKAPPFMGNVVAEVEVIIGSMIIAKAMALCLSSKFSAGSILATFTSALAVAQWFTPSTTQ